MIGAGAWDSADGCFSREQRVGSAGQKHSEGVFVVCVDMRFAFAATRGVDDEAARDGSDVV